MKTLVVGLTGGLGSGKSSVRLMFRKLGARTVDCDAVVRSALENDRALRKAIVKNFGPGVLDRQGRVDRAALARQVFRSSGKRRKLEALLHPRVRAEIRREKRRLKRGVLVCEVPLLFEKKWRDEFDLVLAVGAGEKARRRRLIKRGMKPAEIRARSAAQWSETKKLARADFRIQNDGSLSKTQRQVQRLWWILKP